MEELGYTDKDMTRATIVGVFIGVVVGMILTFLMAMIIFALSKPAQAEVDKTGCITAFTYNRATGNITVRAQKVWDAHPIYKYRFVLADSRRNFHFDDYPRTDVGQLTSTYTRNIRTLRGGKLWAILAFRGLGACGTGILFNNGKL